MKIMMVEGRYTGPISLSRLQTDELPERIGLVSTVQFLDHVDEIKSHLESKGKKVFMGKKTQKYETQLLGCDQGAAIGITEPVDAYLYIGTGNFHPLGVAIQTGKDVYCYDPVNSIPYKISKEEAGKSAKRRKAAFAKFLSVDNIGVLVSIKPGQNLFKKGKDLESRFPEKKFYFFVSDTVDFSQLENFPFIECWVNTACNRIVDDASKFPKPMIDIGEIEKELGIAEIVSLKI